MLTRKASLVRLRNPTGHVHEQMLHAGAGIVRCSTEMVKCTICTLRVSCRP